MLQKKKKKKKKKKWPPGREVDRGGRGKRKGEEREGRRRGKEKKEEGKRLSCIFWKIMLATLLGTRPDMNQLPVFRPTRTVTLVTHRVVHQV